MEREAYKLHDRSYRTLNIDSVISIDGDETSGATQGRQLDEGSIVRHNGFELFRSLRDHPIQLSRKNGCIPRKNGLGLGLLATLRDRPDVKTLL